MTDPPSYDQDLLSRLNALKKSSITLETDECVDQIISLPNAAPQLKFCRPTLSIPKTRSTPETDLASRLRSLRDGVGTTPSPTSSPNARATTNIDAKASNPPKASPAPQAAPLHPESTSRITTNDIKPFITKLEPSPDLTPQAVDETEIHSVLTEARKVLSLGNQKGFDSAKTSTPTGHPLPLKAQRQPGISDSDSGPDSADEEEQSREADDILAQLLEELELEGQDTSERDPGTGTEATTDEHGHKDYKATATAAPAHDNNENEEDIDLPGVPQQDPDPGPPRPKAEQPPDDFEKSIAARLAALKSSSAIDSLGLPSAPTSAVGRRSSSSTGKAWRDETLETWCAICHDGATVVCHGCEEMLYCARCWKEGHMGADAGWEEKGHEWSKYRPPK